MKKKLAAILSLGLVFSVAFASCGDDDDDDETTASKTTASVSATEDEEETTSEKTTENKSDKKSSDDDDENPYSGTIISADEAPEKAVGGDISGSWDMISDDMTFSMVFSNSGKGYALIDFSSAMFFENDHTFNLGGMEFGEDCVSFDGTNLEVEFTPESLGVTADDEKFSSYFTGPVLSLKRADGSSSSDINGEYVFNSGILYDSIFSGSLASLRDTDSAVKIVIKDNYMLLKLEDLFNYETNGNKLSISSPSPILTNFGNKEYEYTIEDDYLYLYNSDATTLKLKRSDFTLN